ncbi:MAG: hypothetical protein IKB70_01915 [Bacilli bacterium]|nr:hypothetical protein [Bacilli bacterium]
MKKSNKILSLLLLVGAFSLTSCGGPTYKTGSGINMAWAEEVGYFARASTVIEEGNTRYVIYETNKKKNENVTSFALRKANKQEDGQWLYEKNRTVILEASSDSWDKYIFSPSVIKGEFKKGETTYNYLLAYGGRKQEKDIANQVGIAYAETLEGPWVKHDKPVIAYDASEYGDEYGAGAPSLLSYNKKGQVRLFHSYAETNLANERVIDCDFSDLNNIILDKGYRHITVNGLRDNADNVILANGDFALDENGTLYLVRDVYPLSGNLPGNATSLQVAKANVAILNNFVSYSWEIVETFTTSMTVDYEDEESMGWDEIYSGSFVRDLYGYISTLDGEIEYYYSTADEPEELEDETYKFSANIAYRKLSV